MILGCPLAGVTADEVIDATPAIRAVAERFLGDPAFSNLPRKYKTSISGCTAGCTNPEINDISFSGVIGPDGEPGYDLSVGGGLSTNPMFAQRLGAFVEPDRVAEVWAGVTGLFREYGYRRSRNHARLKFLVKDWGAGTRSRGAGDRVPGLAVAGRARTDAGADRRRAITWASRRSATAAWRWGSRLEPVGSPGTSSG